MRKNSGAKAAVAGSEAHLLEHDLKQAQEVRKRLQTTLAELHQAVHQIEENLQSAKALLKSLRQDQILEKPLKISLSSQDSHTERRTTRSRFE
jgi:predicted  nucleic acid-binding Zn-ribbon protein